MSKHEKLLRKLRQSPKSIRFEDIDLVLEHFGFERRQPGGGSSHYFYRYKHYRITIARHIPFIHSDAVKDVLRVIDEILDEDAD